MYFLPHITLFAASAILLSETEALPQWLNPSRRFPMNSDSASKGCDKGTCVRAWKCPEEFVIIENSKTCAKDEDTNWVCCDNPSDNDENYLKANLHTTIKPIKLTSVSYDELQHESKPSRDIIYHKKSRESSDIKFPNDRMSSSDIRGDKMTEYADSDPISWEKVTKPSKPFDRREDYWGRDIIDDDESIESSDMRFPNHKIDYSDAGSDVMSANAESYPNFWGKSTKSSRDYERRPDYSDKPTNKSTLEPTKPSHSLIRKNKWNTSLSPTQRTNFNEKRAPNHRGTGPRKSTNAVADTRTTKYSSGETNKKTTPIPVMRTISESYDNHFTNKIRNEAWKQSISVYSKKPTENLRKNNVTSLKWGTTASTKPLGSFWNMQTTSNPLHRKSTSNSENNFSSKKWNNNWEKPCISSAWKTTARNEFQGVSFSSRTENRNNNGMPSSTRRPTLTSTKAWNFSNRRTTTQQYTSSTKRPFVANEPTYTNAWLWPESEENKNYGWESQSSKRSTSTQASSARNFGNIRGPTSSIRRSSTPQNRITTPMPDVQNQICGCRNRDEINMLNQRTTSSERRNTGPRNRYQQSFQRIVGGQEAEPFSWPWVAALYKVTSPGGGNRFLSAGTLINKYYILTAAHVFNSDDLSKSSYVVLLGTHNVTISISEYTVSSILLHPRYEKRYYYNDIALLRLEHPVQFNDYVMPVCLPTRSSAFLKDSDLEGRRVTVMGWGDDEFGGRSSHVLREATFPIASRKSCNASYVRVASNRFPRGITQEMLCAGSPKGGMDACQGDSGGPLLAMENGRYTQVGIVSFGYKCGDKDFPGVYTKVAYYMGWITENTQQLRT